MNAETAETPIRREMFSVVDYVIFIALIVVSMVIGVTSGMKGFRQATTKDFFLGGRKMHPIPVSMSLIGGVISALSVLGNPTEIYLYGTQLWLNLLGALWGTLVVMFILLPVLYPLDLVSMMQYLELRFGSVLLKKLGSMSQLLNFSLYLGICLYTPSLALSSVTSISNWISIIVLGVVCAIYITIGGVKAVVYTDVFQTSVMFIGVIAVVIRVCSDLGGISNLFQIAEQGQRLEFFNMDPSPFIRHTFWSVQALGLYFVVSILGISQAQFQRLASVRSLRQSQILCILFLIGLVALWSLFNISGLAAYAVYHDCDPIKNQDVEKKDQIIPYLVAEKLGHVPGMTGLFVAAIYGAVLSSISSQANAFSALVWEDFLLDWSWFQKAVVCLSSTSVTRIISAMAGVLGILLAFLVGSMGTLFQASYSISGAIISPLDGLFITGISAPWVNKKGAICGFLVAFSFNMWLVIGKFIYGSVKLKELPLSTAGCTNSAYNSTTTSFETTSFPSLTTVQNLSTVEENDDGRPSVFDVSYCYLGSIGILIVFSVSTVVSVLTGVNNPNEVNERLIYGPSFKFYKWIWKKTHKVQDSTDMAEFTKD